MDEFVPKPLMETRIANVVEEFNTINVSLHGMDYWRTASILPPRLTERFKGVCRGAPRAPCRLRGHAVRRCHEAGGGGLKPWFPPPFGASLATAVPREGPHRDKRTEMRGPLRPAAEGHPRESWSGSRCHSTGRPGYQGAQCP